MTIAPSAQLDRQPHPCGPQTIEIRRLDTFRLTAQVAQGPVSSLAPMPMRRGLLLRLEDRDGAHGWGEVWCNFPPHGAEARAHLLNDVFHPLVVGARFDSWSSLRPRLTEKLARMMIHTGEAGPFLHCLAGLDMAMADLAARRAGVSMAEFMGGPAGIRDVAVYASSPSRPDQPAQCAELADTGHAAIKLKVGNAAETDLRVVQGCRAAIAAGTRLMADANQAWTAAQAIAQIQVLSAFGLEFIEEPMRADAGIRAWAELSARSPLVIAAGENIASASDFEAMVLAKALGVIQPDVAKWGGISGAMQVGRFALAHGARCCFHFMGTGLGLAASLHCLAALGGDGMVELDANENPLRSELGPLDLRVNNGCLALPEGPGFGFEPASEALRRLGSCGR